MHLTSSSFFFGRRTFSIVTPRCLYSSFLLTLSVYSSDTLISIGGARLLRSSFGSNSRRSYRTFLFFDQFTVVPVPNVRKLVTADFYPEFVWNIRSGISGEACFFLGIENTSRYQLLDSTRWKEPRERKNRASSSRW